MKSVQITNARNSKFEFFKRQRNAEGGSATFTTTVTTTSHPTVSFTCRVGK